MKRNLPSLDELIRIVWPMLNPVQRLALLLRVLGYDLLNRFERIEVRFLTLLAFLLNIAAFQHIIPDHPLKPFLTYGTAFYTAALLLMIATWPPRRKTAHGVR